MSDACRQNAALMIGAIAGDVVGSPYEFRPHKSVDFPLLRLESCFTDDTLLTIATARAIISGEHRGSHPPRRLSRR